MKAQAFKELARFLAGMSELYGKALSKPLVQLYWELLSPYSFDQVEQAFQSHMMDPDCGQYFPKPADLIRLIDGSTQAQALIAWSKVTKAVRNWGVYYTVVFDDPRIHAVIRDMGGWIALCQSSVHQWIAQERTFCTRYRDYLTRKLAVYPACLEGIFNQRNRLTDYGLLEPVYVGDPECAKQVFLSGDYTLRLVHGSKPS